MAKCRLCGAETILHENGVPICVACANDRDAGNKPDRRQGTDENEPETEVAAPEKRAILSGRYNS